VKNASTTNPRRIHDDPITLITPEGLPIDLNLSDHFGYQATVNFAPM